MARNPNRKLDQVYAQVPQVGCKGLCAAFCCVVPMLPLEAERIQERHARPLPVAVGRSLQCPLLSDEDRCTVYEARPFVCRLWGTVEALKCPHGCEPPEWLTAPQAERLLREYHAVQPDAELVILWQKGVGE